MLPLCHCTHAPTCHHLPLVSPEPSDDGEEESGALNGPEQFSQEPYYIYDEMIDASCSWYWSEWYSCFCMRRWCVCHHRQGRTNWRGHWNDDMAADSNVTIFSPTEKALQAWRHLAPTQAMTWRQSVLNQLWILMTLLTVPMMMKSFCLYLESELEASMDEVFRFIHITALW